MTELEYQLQQFDMNLWKTMQRPNHTERNRKLDQAIRSIWTTSSNLHQETYSTFTQAEYYLRFGAPLSKQWEALRTYQTKYLFRFPLMTADQKLLGLNLLRADLEMPQRYHILDKSARKRNNRTIAPFRELYLPELQYNLRIFEQEGATRSEISSCNKLKKQAQIVMWYEWFLFRGLELLSRPAPSPNPSQAELLDHYLETLKQTLGTTYGSSWTSPQWQYTDRIISKANQLAYAVATDARKKQQFDFADNLCQMTYFAKLWTQTNRNESEYRFHFGDATDAELVSNAIELLQRQLPISKRPHAEPKSKDDLIPYLYAYNQRVFEQEGADKGAQRELNAYVSNLLQFARYLGLVKQALTAYRTAPDTKPIVPSGKPLY